MNWLDASTGRTFTNSHQLLSWFAGFNSTLVLNFCFLTIYTLESFVDSTLTGYAFIYWNNYLSSLRMRYIRRQKVSIFFVLLLFKWLLINRAAMGRARFIIYPWFNFLFNRAAIGRARFIIYPWFFFFLTARPLAERGS